MKKLVGLLAALVLAGGSIFAGDFYNGDIQIQLGFALDKATAEDIDAAINAKVFNGGIESWHLFKPVDMFGVGLMAGFNAGVGKTDRWSTTLTGFGDTNSKMELKGNKDGLSWNLNFNIGPAVAFYAGDIVRIGANFGFATGFNFDEPYKAEFNTENIRGSTSASFKASYTGFTTGVQAKFFPDFFINPVIGWRFIRGTSKSVDYNVGSFKSSLNKKYTFTQNVIYAALAFSW